MNILSLFDGMSCGRLALQRAGIKVDKYFASEIDPYAIKVSQYNFPDIIQLGDITKWKQWEDISLPKIDLILAGSPCQGFSRAGKELNFNDERSKLFFDFIDILTWYKPTYFLLENVVMRKEYQDIISSYLGVEPIVIDSALVSAQSRKRLYWTNIPNVTQPEDKKILLKDIVFSDVEPIAVHNIYGGFKEDTARIFTDKSPTIRTAAGGGHIPSLLLTKEGLDYMDRKVADGRNHWDFAHHSDIANAKSATVVANFFKGVPYNVFRDEHCIRKFDPVECERLQTLPDNYTKGVSTTQRYKMIGNGWTVDVISHILKGVI